MIRKNLYILSLLASVISFAQVNLYSKISSKEARVNSPLVFTVVLEIMGEDLVQESPLQLPDFSKFNFDYASEQNTLIDPVKKIRINQMICEISLDPKQTGNIKIGSVLVRVNGKIYKTEPIDIVVKDAEKKPLAKSHTTRNMYLNMQVSDRDVYKNEPVVAVIKAFSKNLSGFRHLEPAKFEASKNFAIRSVADFDESIETSENDFSSQIVAMFVMVPKVTGYVDMPAAEVPVINNSNTLVSNKVKINVKKLPAGAPKSYKNAVGKYRLSVELLDKGKENFEVNKAFNIAVKLEGQGNMSPAILPKIIPSQQYDIYPPKIVNNSIATPEGIQGEIEARYIVIPKKRGGVKVETEDFSYFDPQTEKYVDLGSGLLTLATVNAQDIANSRTALERVNDYTNNVLETVNSPVINTNSLKIEKNKGFNWIGIVGNLLIVVVISLIFMVLYRRYSKSKKQHKKSKTPQKPIVNIAETEALLRKNNKPDVNAYYVYLEKMIDKSDADKFFYALEDLKAEANLYCHDHFSLDFEDFLRSNHLDIYNRYVDLQRLIDIEKYAPFSSKEKQKYILDEVRQIFDVL